MNDYANFYEQAKAESMARHNNKSTTDYSEALFQSIDTIVSERIKRLPYDYTIVATITNADNAYIGAYKVTTDNNTVFTAYSEIKTYSVGDHVYIRIVDTNYNSSKIITGKYVEHVNISDISSSDVIEYIIDGHPEEPHLQINKELAAQGYYLEIYPITPISAYAPDTKIPIEYKNILHIRFFKLDIINNQFVAIPQTTYTYNYGINDGTSIVDYNVILEDQYELQDEQTVTTTIGIIPEISFTPAKQAIQSYISLRAYVTLPSGIYIRSNIFIIKSDVTRSAQYQQFTITASKNQFFCFNAKGKLLPNANTSTKITIEYLNTLNPTATFNEEFDSLDLTTLNSNTQMFDLEHATITWYDNTIEIDLALNSSISINQTFLTETLTFGLIKDGIPYPLTKDFYFGYQQIDSITNSDAIQLYLNNNDILKYYKLKIGDLFEAGPGETVKIGGSNYAVTNGNWAGNAATATTATKLAAAPSLAASGNKITITAGEKTSAAFTIPFATTATTATELADAPSLAANNNKITITAGGKTSSAFTVPYASTATTATTAAAADKINTNAGSLTTPVYFTGGVPAIITSLDETLLGFNSSNSNFSSNGQNTKLYEWLKAIQTNMNTLAAQHNITLTWPATL